MKIERINSRNNETLQHARRVRDGKERDSIFIEGSRLCGEAVLSDMKIGSVFVTERFMGTGSFESLTEQLQTVVVVSESLLESIADTTSPQGIVIIARRPGFKSAEVGTVGTSLFLYRVNNPSNLGALMRTAEAAGVGEILISTDSADPFSPKALRASMGSAFRSQIAEGCILETTIARAKKKGIEVIAVDSKGASIYSTNLTEKAQMFVFGSEAHGLPDEILGTADSIVSIPMSSPVESLNLAVSCGIVLFESRRQSQQAQ